MKKKPAFYFHFLEIQRRIFYIFFSFFFTFLMCYYSALDLIYFFVKPFLSYDKPFIFTDLTEALYTLLKICALTTTFFSLPIFFYHIWSFFIPSFYSKDRKKINFFIFSFFLLGFWSIWFTYFLALPQICDFLLTFEIKGEQLSLELEARIDSYISWSFRLFFLIFSFYQLPLFFLLLIELKVLTGVFFSKGRRYFFFFSLLTAAFISPPDLFSQWIIAFCLFFSYELIIWLACLQRTTGVKFFHPTHKKEGYSSNADTNSD